MSSKQEQASLLGAATTTTASAAAAAGNLQDGSSFASDGRSPDSTNSGTTPFAFPGASPINSHGKLWGVVRRNISQLSAPSSPASPQATPVLAGRPAPPNTPLTAAERSELEDAAFVFNRATSLTLADSFAGAESAMRRRQSSFASRASVDYGAAAAGEDGAEQQQDGQKPQRTTSSKLSSAGGTAEDSTAPSYPPPPTYRFLRFAFLLFVMSVVVGGCGEGVQTFFSVLAKHGVFAEQCAKVPSSSAASGSNSNSSSSTEYLRNCKKAQSKIATVIVVGLGTMNIVQAGSGLAVDALGVRTAATFGALAWGVCTGIGGLSPESGYVWATSFTLQQCANGFLFLAIFTGLIKQLATSDKEFAVMSSIASGCWDAGGAAGYIYREWLAIDGLSFAVLMVILGAVLGIFPSALFWGLFKEPATKLTKEGLALQLDASKLILKKPVFWLVTLLMTMVCTSGYATLAYIGDIMRWKRATEEETESIRPWVGNIIALSCIFAVVPGKLMSSSLGIFGGVAATCLFVSLLAAAIIVVLLAGGPVMQYLMLALMATLRTCGFTIVNAFLPLFLLLEDQMHGTHLVTATGMAFGISSLVAGCFSTGVGFLLGALFEPGSSPNSSSVNSTSAIASNSTTTTAVPEEAIASDSVFSVSFTIIWGLTLIAPLLLAVRCRQLQARHDEHEHHRHHHHHHHHHDHAEEGEDDDKQAKEEPPQIVDNE